MNSLRFSFVRSFLLFTLAACGAPSASELGDTPNPAEKPVLTCTTTCGAACAAGTVCVGTASVYNSGYQPECLKTCTVSQDCPSGGRCTAMFGESAAGRVCVSKAAPTACRTPDARWHCDFPPARCESDILLRPFSESSNYTCGTEYIRCASGCVPATPAESARCK